MLLDGSNSNFGNMKGIKYCIKECDKHEECLGFVHSNINDGTEGCGYWKGGTLAPKVQNNHGCYTKIIETSNLETKYSLLINIFLINILNIVWRRYGTPTQ